MDFFNALDQFGENIDNLDNYLLALGGQIVAELRANAPVDEGDLRNSITAIVENDTLVLGMLTYGAFTNYGVRGTEDQLGIEVPSGVTPPPFMGSTYQFKERRFGIRDYQTRYGRTWIDWDALTQRVYDAVTNEITNI